MIKDNGLELFSNFSENIYRNKILGFLISVIIDIVYINAWRKKFNLLAMIIQVFIVFLLSNIILQNIFGMKITQ